MKEDESNMDENLEETLEKVSSLSVKTGNRISEAAFLEVIAESMCICLKCDTRFIRRKSKVVCPQCHSNEIKF